MITALRKMPRQILPGGSGVLNQEGRRRSDRSHLKRERANSNNEKPPVGGGTFPPIFDHPTYYFTKKLGAVDRRLPRQELEIVLAAARSRLMGRNVFEVFGGRSNTKLSPVGSALRMWKEPRLLAACRIVISGSGHAIALSTELKTSN
jgi:hypothetical protein